jgi:peptide/nickel transport system substrate-binding protein
MGQPVSGDWAIVRYESEPDTLNPLLNRGSMSSYAISGINNSQIYEFLMGYNTKDWRLTEPLIAEAPPDISDDHLTYIFTIRDRVKWHDGQPLAPDDVIFSFKAIMCPLVDSAPKRSYLTDLADVQVEGRKVRFLMSRPNALNISNLASIVPIIPKHIFDPEGLLDQFSYRDIIGPKGKVDPKIKKFSNQMNSHPANRAPIGSGPFKFEKWETGKEIVLSRNGEYWGNKPYLDKLVLRFITDNTAALTALKAGEVDLQPRLQPVQYAQQTSGAAFDERFTKVKYSIPAVTFVVWNNERPFFNDKRVRQAMTMIIDRQKIIDSIRLGMGRIATGVINPQSADFDPSIKPWPYDPKRAAETLDDTGWKDHDGDGIRDKNGVRFRFEFLASTGSTLFTQLSPVLRDELRQVGIEMTERIVDFNVLTSVLTDHKFDAALLTMTSDLGTDPYQVWHSTSAVNGGSNYANFKNAESDHLLEQVRLEFDAEKRKQLYWKWQELINEEQPWTFLFYQEDSAAYSKRFQGVKWLPLRPGYDLNTWWVPRDRQKYSGATAR